MKKIKRIGDNGGNVVFVYDSDLDKLEQQRDEAEKMIIEIWEAFGESNNIHPDVFNSLVSSYFEKYYGQWWEEIKAGE
jgi:N-glycosylase/DNA lyase